MASHAVIKLSVQVNSPSQVVTREVLATTLGAWIENLPLDCRTIETDFNGEQITINVICAIRAE